MSQSANPQTRMMKAVDETFAQFFQATATVEALLPLVSKQFGRSVIASQLRSFLHKYPMRYRQDDAARWSLIQAAQVADEAEDIPLEQTDAQLVATLRPGTYVVFD